MSLIQLHETLGYSPSKFFLDYNYYNSTILMAQWETRTQNSGGPRTLEDPVPWRARDPSEPTVQRTCLVFMMLTFKKTAAKNSFLQYEICIKTLRTKLHLPLHQNVSAQLSIVAQPVFHRNPFLSNLQHFLFQELNRYTQNP